MSKFDHFKNCFIRWNNTLKQLLNEIRSTNEKLFIVNLKIFENIAEYHPINNDTSYNLESLFKDKKILSNLLIPNKKFLLIDQICWENITNLLPNEKEFKVDVFFVIKNVVLNYITYYIFII